MKTFIVNSYHGFKAWISQYCARDKWYMDAIYKASIPFGVVWLILTIATILGLGGLWVDGPNCTLPEPSWAQMVLGQEIVPLCDENTKRFHYLAIAGLTTVLGGLLAAPLALVRLHNVERQTTATEEGLITDRINKAVEGLGAVQTVKRQMTDADGKLIFEQMAQADGTVEDMHDRPIMEEITIPNMAVRIGAIYALERISQDSARDHIQIMEILCAYIRENAPASAAPSFEDFPEYSEGTSESSDYDHEAQIQAWIREKLQGYAPRTDVQTALTVIGRRSRERKELEWGKWRPFEEAMPEFPKFENNPNFEDELNAWQYELRKWRSLQPLYRLDLRKTNLAKMDMSGNANQADWSLARFEKAILVKTNFEGASAQAAKFYFAEAQAALFSSAKAQAAQFIYANAQQANFSSAKTAAADFSGANADAAKFSFASAQAANFQFAELQAADFTKAEFTEQTFTNGAKIHFASFVGSDLSPFSQEQVNSVFGDASTQLGAHDRPDQWPKTSLNRWQSIQEWEKFIKDPENYEYVAPETDEVEN